MAARVHPGAGPTDPALDSSVPDGQLEQGVGVDAGASELAAPASLEADRVEQRGQPRRFRLGPALVLRREIDHGVGQGQGLNGKVPRLDSDHAGALADNPAAVHEPDTPRRLAGPRLEINA